MTGLRVETGDSALGRAKACDVPGWERVVEVRFDREVRFMYADGGTWTLPPITEAAR